MKRLLCILALFLVAACASAPTPREEISDPGELLFNGYVHANVHCYTCHGTDGTGTWKGSNLVGIGRRESRAEIVDAILAGPGIMPSFEGKLTDAELDQLADWLLRLE